MAPAGSRRTPRRGRTGRDIALPVHSAGASAAALGALRPGGRLPAGRGSRLVTAPPGPGLARGPADPGPTGTPDRRSEVLTADRTSRADRTSSADCTSRVDRTPRVDRTS